MEQVAKRTYLEKVPDAKAQHQRVRDVLEAEHPYVMIHLEELPNGEPLVNLTTTVGQAHTVMVLEMVLARAKAVTPGNSN